MLLPHHIQNNLEANLHNADVLFDTMRKHHKTIRFSKETDTLVKKIEELSFRVLNVEPNNYKALANIRWCLWFKNLPYEDREKRREYYTRKMLEIRPDKFFLLVQLGSCLFRQKRYNESIAVFVEAIRHPRFIKDGSYINLTSDIAKCHNRLNKLTKETV
jgi:tetratricopeptide (TPR) repeat protein